MHIDISKYMSERIHIESGPLKEAGPVITISREYGCPSKLIACNLAAELTRKSAVKGKEAKWKYVTKEIMAESARALEVDPEKIRYVFDYQQKSMLDDILSAQFTKYYKSERKIRNTIGKVIRNMAQEGHVIIVGRGGVAITRDIPWSLHVNLEAPLDWRVLRVSENYHISHSEARKTAIEVDRKRKEFRDYFQGKDTDYTRFDISFNCMTFTIDEIVQMILKAADTRKLV
jgi:cytidylate kinase